MRGAGACHMCGRCADFRGAVTLARRSPSHEIIHVAGDMPNKWQSALILFGLNGVAARRLSVGLLVALCGDPPGARRKLVDAGADLADLAGAAVVAADQLPRPERRHDAARRLCARALCARDAARSSGCRRASASRWPRGSVKSGSTGSRFHHFAQALIPVAGCGVFLGLSSLTVTMLKAEGYRASLHRFFARQPADRRGAVVAVAGLAHRADAQRRHFAAPLAAVIAMTGATADRMRGLGEPVLADFLKPAIVAQPNNESPRVSQAAKLQFLPDEFGPEAAAIDGHDPVFAQPAGKVHRIFP